MGFFSKPFVDLVYWFLLNFESPNLKICSVNPFQSVKLPLRREMTTQFIVKLIQHMLCNKSFWVHFEMISTYLKCQWRDPTQIDISRIKGKFNIGIYYSDKDTFFCNFISSFLYFSFPLVGRIIFYTRLLNRKNQLFYYRISHLFLKLLISFHQLNCKHFFDTGML